MPSLLEKNAIRVNKVRLRAHMDPHILRNPTSTIHLVIETLRASPADHEFHLQYQKIITLEDTGTPADYQTHPQHLWIMIQLLQSIGPDFRIL